VPFLTLASPIGTLILEASDRGLRKVVLPGDQALPDESVIRPDHPVLNDTATQISEYFAGRRQTFSVPLDLDGTEFQRTVWMSLAEIPFGATQTYGQQAERIGRPRAARAVGAANGRNPVPIVLPCHRVIGSDGSLTGFAGGLECKQQLLNHERVVHSGLDGDR